MPCIRPKPNGWPRHWRGWGRLVLRSLMATLALLSPSALMAQSDKDASIITGVVDGVGGGGGFQPQSGASWTSSFQLVAWRVSTPKGEGPVRTDTLRIEIPNQRQADLAHWASIFPARALVRFTIREPVREVNGRAIAELRATLPNVADAELLAAAEPILNPPPVIDPLFGTFTSDRQFPQSFRHRHEWLGREIDIVLALDYAGPPGPEAAQMALTRLHAVWSNRETWDARIREAIAAAYYEVWTDNWRDDGAPMVDRAAFKRRFILSEVSISPQGDLNFGFADNDLFWGHAISVEYDAETETFDVSMFG